MKIGILSCGHTVPEVAKTHGDFPQMFERLLTGNGLSFAAYDVENMDFPTSINACDGWLLTGSRHGAYEDHAFIPPLEKFIQDAHAAQIPMVGICFGHQIIAQALGGKVVKFDGGWDLGLTEYEFDDVGRVQLNAWHQDQVVELPSEACVVGRNDFCANAALTYGNHIFTVQAHPEFTGDIVAKYVGLRRGTADYPDQIMDRALARKDTPDSNAVLAKRIANFFHAAIKVPS